MDCSDFEYFLERAMTEREMAKAAKHLNAVAAHEELASRYDALIRCLAPSTDYVETVGRLAEEASRANRHLPLSNEIRQLKPRATHGE